MHFEVAVNPWQVLTIACEVQRFDMADWQVVTKYFWLMDLSWICRHWGMPALPGGDGPLDGRDCNGISPARGRHLRRAAASG